MGNNEVENLHQSLCFVSSFFPTMTNMICWVKKIVDSCSIGIKHFSGLNGLTMQHVRHSNCRRWSWSKWAAEAKLASFWGENLVISDRKKSGLEKGTDLDKVLILDVIKNLKSCKNFYNNACNTIAASLNVYLLSIADYIYDWNNKYGFNLGRKRWCFKSKF